MTDESLLASVFAKLRRAHEHIEEFQRERIAFLQDDATPTPLINYDTAAAEAFRRFHESRPIPMRLSVIVGEVAYQLRSALDHLICAFVSRDGGTVGRQQFPIRDTRPVLKKDVDSYDRQIDGIKNDDVRALIDSYQPYHKPEAARPKYAFTILKELSNADKHRALAIQVVRVDPSILVRARDVESGGEEVVYFDVEESSTEIAVGQDLLGFPVLDVERRLSADLAFGGGARVPPLVFLRLKWLDAYFNRVVARFRRLL